MISWHKCGLKKKVTLLCTEAASALSQSLCAEKNGHGGLLVHPSSVQFPVWLKSLNIPRDLRALLIHSHCHLCIMNKESVTLIWYFLWNLIKDCVSWKLAQRKIPNILSVVKITLFPPVYPMLESFPYHNWNFVTDSFYKMFNNNISFSWAFYGRYKVLYIIFLGALHSLPYTGRIKTKLCRCDNQEKKKKGYSKLNIFLKSI